jgi:hypothetical protein
VRVLVACEYSGRVREAFRKRGHDAWSCDIEPSEDSSPYHLRVDVRDVLWLGRWDLMICHPPCTYLALCQTWRVNRCKLRERERCGSRVRSHALDQRHPEDLHGEPQEPAVDAPRPQVADHSPVAIRTPRVQGNMDLAERLAATATYQRPRETRTRNRRVQTMGTYLPHGPFTATQC